MIAGHLLAVMEAATALPSLDSGMRDGITRQVGLILGKGPFCVYPPSSIPNIKLVRSNLEIYQRQCLLAISNRYSTLVA